MSIMTAGRPHSIDIRIVVALVCAAVLVAVLATRMRVESATREAVSSGAAVIGSVSEDGAAASTSSASAASARDGAESAASGVVVAPAAAAKSHAQEGDDALAPIPEAHTAVAIALERPVDFTVRVRPRGWVDRGKTIAVCDLQVVRQIGEVDAVDGRVLSAPEPSDHDYSSQLAGLTIVAATSADVRALLNRGLPTALRMTLVPTGDSATFRLHGTDG